MFRLLFSVCSCLFLPGRGGRGWEGGLRCGLLSFPLLYPDCLYFFLTCLVLVVLLFLLLPCLVMFPCFSFLYIPIAIPISIPSPASRRVSIYPFTIQWMILPHYVAYCCVAYIIYTWSIDQWYNHGIMVVSPPRGVGS